MVTFKHTCYFFVPENTPQHDQFRASHLKSSLLPHNKLKDKYYSKTSSLESTSSEDNQINHVGNNQSISFV